MGNALILILITTFGVVWTMFAPRGVWALFAKLFGASRSSLRAAWYWGATSITLGLLAGFAGLSIALPPLLARLFSSSREVSVSMIALAIVVVLSLSWLLSLNRYRALIEDFYEELAARTSR